MPTWFESGVTRLPLRSPTGLGNSLQSYFCALGGLRPTAIAAFCLVVRCRLARFTVELEAALAKRSEL